MSGPCRTILPHCSTFVERNGGTQQTDQKVIIHCTRSVLQISNQDWQHPLPVPGSGITLASWHHVASTMWRPHVAGKQPRGPQWSHSRVSFWPVTLFLRSRRNIGDLLLWSTTFIHLRVPCWVRGIPPSMRWVILTAPPRPLKEVHGSTTRSLRTFQLGKWSWTHGILMDLGFQNLETK